jgi:vacuolar protein sorting-associated protein IST1
VDWGHEYDKEEEEEEEEDASSASKGSDGGDKEKISEPPLENDQDSDKRDPAVRIAPPSPSSENIHPQLKLPHSVLPSRRKSSNGSSGSAIPKSSSAKSSAPPSLPQHAPKPPTESRDVPQVDELMRRFEVLKGGK